MNISLDLLLAHERRRQGALLRRAALLAALVSSASVVLLGLSGWFITAAALAGAAGTVAAHGFNYMLPSAAIRLLAILRSGARYGEALAAHGAALNALARVRPALFRAVAAMPPVRALAFTPGDATARLVNDVALLEQDMVRRSAVPAAVAALLSGVALTVLGGWAAALATAGWLGLTIASAHWLTRRLDGANQRTQRANGELKAVLGTLVAAAPELRCYDLLPWSVERVDAASRELADAQVARADVLGWVALLHGGATGAAAVTALVLATPSGAPAAALAALAAAMTLDGGAPLLRRFAERAAVQEATERLDTVLSTPEGSKLAIDPTAAPVLELLQLGAAPIGPGDRVALVGRSGCGKTTLVEQFLGLRAVAPGRATLYGIDIAFLPHDALRRAFAWSPQDAPLLAGTVRDNLLLAAPNADDADLWRALHDAALDDRVRALPDALDSWIGDNGERLSGGERRRLSLARAYLADAPWLLLDEPSEGLDAATEAMVADRLRARLARTGQGLILITHRGALARACTRRVIALDRPDLSQAA